jgi:hypothetical protein
LPPFGSQYNESLRDISALLPQNQQELLYVMLSECTGKMTSGEPGNCIVTGFLHILQDLSSTLDLKFTRHNVIGKFASSVNTIKVFFTCLNIME